MAQWANADARASLPPRACWTGRLARRSTIERLRVAMPTDRVNGWIVTLIIGAIAFVIRFVNLGYPNKLVFDETYYAKDAYSLLKFDTNATGRATPIPRSSLAMST